MARYDHIDFTPPQGVREACMRGVVLHEQGVSGDGIEPETVGWARRLSRGERVTAAKARQMARFFARNQRFQSEPKDSAAWASWQLWGGHAGDAWSEKLVAQMDAADEKATQASDDAPEVDAYRARVSLLADYVPERDGLALYFVTGEAEPDAAMRDVTAAPGVVLTFYPDGRLFALSVDDARRVVGDEIVTAATAPGAQCE